MSIIETRPSESAARLPRSRFLRRAAAAGAGLGVTGLLAGPARAAGATCSASPRGVFDALLVAEQIATTLYYTGLSASAVVSHPYLAGSSANPNQVAGNGSRINVACLQAALDQEMQHAAILVGRGAASAHTAFFFPATTFDGLGYTRQPGTFLSVMDHLETVMIGGYLAAVQRLAALGHADDAQFFTRMLGPECQHRAIGRVISGDTPANNVALEVSSFSCIDDLTTALQPYLTGKGFATGVAKAHALPAAAAVSQVVGLNRSI